MNATNSQNVPDLRCPGCDNDAAFTLTAQVFVSVAGDDVEDVTEPAWDDRSRCECGLCGRTGTVGGFKRQPLLKTN